MSPFDLKTEDKLIDFLQQEKFLTPSQIQEVQTEIQASGESFEAALFRKGFLKDADLGKIIADLYGWNFVNLKTESITEETLALISEALAREHHVLVFGKTEEGIKIAMKDPRDTALLQTLQAELQAPLIPYFATPKDLAANLDRYQVKIEEEFSRLIEDQMHEATFKGAEESAIVKLVALLLTHGYKKKASDIHLDPQGDETMIRFRIDGVLHDVVKMPKAIHVLVISRLKVMARLHTDEHQAPQDGKIHFKVEGENADIRLSIMPTTYGENAVMRLLSEKSREFSLQDLGLSEKDFQKLNHAINQPWGMILSTGPTGSGKTTSLYAILKILNIRDVNIATIEDPVEYSIPGITQIQVNPKANLTFSAGLRSLVRQDPNIIMVGEIRDEETADIAVNSAMTGHLVLSTLHTNDAATALPRLLEMGVERYLVASTVNLIIGQRLVRRICQRCITTDEREFNSLKDFLPPSAVEKLDRNKKKIIFYKGAGCELCGKSGFLGRVGVFEVLEVTDSIRKLIMQNADADDIRKEARKEGMDTMFEDAIAKALTGLTSLEEVLRVVKD